MPKYIAKSQEVPAQTGAGKNTVKTKNKESYGPNSVREISTSIQFKNGAKKV